MEGEKSGANLSAQTLIMGGGGFFFSFPAGERSWWDVFSPRG